MALIGTASSCADDYNTDPLTKNTILSSITIDEKYEVYTLVRAKTILAFLYFAGRCD